jgi:membrane protein DedA with SNARE-associated domain
MPEELAFYISKYGYAAILTIIILQEIGVPSPIPVEVFVFSTGYLSYKGLIYLPYAIIAAITADLTGAGILYVVFFTSGTFLIKKRPRWFPVSEKKISLFQERINKGAWVSIFMFRLVSLSRGYAAVISGLFHLNLRIYVPTVVLSAIAWTSFYAILGFVLGPASNMVLSNTKHFKFILLILLLLILSISAFYWLRKKIYK